MRIQFIDPLSRAWGRMTKALFKPFDFSKWLVVGFSAFLAELMDFQGEGGSQNYQSHHFEFSDIFAFPQIAWEWLNQHPFWFTLIVVGIFFLIALAVVLTWLSSRGKFIFLDNVVYDRAKIAQPWNDYSRLGNSLFLWRLVFGIICFAIFIFFVVTGFIVAYNIYREVYTVPALVGLIAGLILIGLIIFIITAYISLFLNDFIVPIMYKFNLKTVPAWNRFLKLLGSHTGSFILYGLLIFALSIIIVIAIVFFGLFTCCCGFLVLIIPYVSTVILLPVSYTFRAFSVEFLEQFGEDYKIFPAGNNDSSGASAMQPGGAGS